MGNWAAEAFAKHEVRFKAQVMADTWGHLAPVARREYKGYIVFTQSVYGDNVPIDCAFAGLDDSPWFYDDLIEFVDNKAKKAGTVYRFEGKYVKFKNGGHRFTGTIKRAKVMF